MKHKHKFKKPLGMVGDWSHLRCACGVVRGHRYRMGSNKKYDYKYYYPPFWSIFYGREKEEKPARNRAFDIVDTLF